MNTEEKTTGGNDKVILRIGGITIASDPSSYVVKNGRPPTYHPTLDTALEEVWAITQKKYAEGNKAKTMDGLKEQLDKHQAWFKKQLKPFDVKLKVEFTGGDNYIL